MSIRLALLLCDTPPPLVQKTDGTYTDIFNALLTNSSPSTNYTLDSFDVKDKMEYPNKIDDYQGIILTGSAASAYDNLEWINTLVAYIASVAEDKPHIKLLGICFGHQIISRALGEDCVPNEGRWEAGITPVELTEAGKQLFGTPEPNLNIQQMHRDHIPAVPKSCILLGSTTITENQGFIRFSPSSDSAQSPSPPSLNDKQSIKDIQIFTVQGHPEFTKRIVDSLVDLRAETGVLPADVVAQARDRADWRNDGVNVIGRVLWRILGIEEE